MEVMYALTLIVVSLTTGQTLPETSRIHYGSKSQCIEMGEFLSESRATLYGFNLRVDYRCDPVQ